MGPLLGSLLCAIACSSDTTLAPSRVFISCSKSGLRLSPLQAEHAWRNQLDLAAPLSVDEIQRREQWEAEEAEALLLIAAVYGDAYADGAGDSSSAPL